MDIFGLLILLLFILAIIFGIINSGKVAFVSEEEKESAKQNEVSLFNGYKYGGKIIITLVFALISVIIGLLIFIYVMY